jgi:hypothetical protein
MNCRWGRLGARPARNGPRDCASGTSSRSAASCLPSLRLSASVVGPVRRAIAYTRQATHPLGCHHHHHHHHHHRISDQTVLDKLIQLLVFGCSYRRIADATYSTTTIRRRRDQWAAARLMQQLEPICWTPTTGWSASTWESWPRAGASPRRPAMGRPLGRAPSTSPSPAGFATAHTWTGWVAHAGAASDDLDDAVHDPQLADEPAGRAPAMSSMHL